MRLQLARWGNSLALRIPAEYVRAAGLREGDLVDADLTPTGEILIRPGKCFDKRAFVERARKLRARMPLTAPVVQTMRDDSRF
ncbi:MAG: AbrB/MazE/SpoVT family DNA-binding domain-containing protein [Burkholderiales bacterium]|nr:MAG: AbrB/MazE/SpoVT family DNA-binding domain-containing protein [Burkholderiales bacterium]